MSLPEPTPREHEVAAAECDAVAAHFEKLAGLHDGPLAAHFASHDRVSAMTLRARAERHRTMASTEAMTQADHALQIAHARLDRAKDALVATGYFTEDQVGPDIAPRITEMFSALKREITEDRA